MGDQACDEPFVASAAVGVERGVDGKGAEAARVLEAYVKRGRDCGWGGRGRAGEVWSGVEKCAGEKSGVAGEEEAAVVGLGVLVV